MISRALLIGLLAFASYPANATAQGIESTAKISFDVTGAFERAAAVSGELRIPESKRERLPAVVIVNSSPGFDGRGAFYAESLNQAGIATLEIDMLQGRGIPASPRDNMPHAYQTLQHLARHPRIDETRIGIMGFSWGAIISLLTSSETLARQYGGGNLRFAAHLGMYPQCWALRTVLSGKDKSLEAGILARVTGRSVHIIVGDKDDYDDPDGCTQFLAQLAAQVRPHFSLTVFEGATFAWDSRFSSATYSAGARKGRGGIVNVIADPLFSQQSRAFTTTYFRKTLGAD